MWFWLLDASSKMDWCKPSWWDPKGFFSICLFLAKIFSVEIEILLSKTKEWKLPKWSTNESLLRVLGENKDISLKETPMFYLLKTRRRSSIPDKEEDQRTQTGAGLLLARQGPHLPCCAWASWRSARWSFSGRQAAPRWPCLAGHRQSYRRLHASHGTQPLIINWDRESLRSERTRCSVAVTTA